MHQIIIIGTTPPCPRCRLLTEIVTVMSKLMELDAAVRHISYTSEEAAALADTVSLKPGTAKDVARHIGKELNLEGMPKKAEGAELGFIDVLDPNLKQFEGLIREVHILDRWLRPFEDQAKDAGILMTPVLMINGAIKHNGSVPDLSMIDRWLSELK